MPADPSPAPDEPGAELPAPVVELALEEEAWADALGGEERVESLAARGAAMALAAAGVEVRAAGALAQIDGTVPASEADWGKEYLDMIIAAKPVADVDAAIAHIRRYGSSHTDCIIAEEAATVARFFERLDSAILMHNASTQFADGGEFGMGAEIGIATGKMHARGPVGARELTSYKYLVTGQGTLRG